MAAATTPATAATHSVFVYGSLMADEVVSAVLSRVPASSPALLTHQYARTDAPRGGARATRAGQLGLFGSGTAGARGAGIGGGPDKDPPISDARRSETDYREGGRLTYTR